MSVGDKANTCKPILLDEFKVGEKAVYSTISHTDGDESIKLGEKRTFQGSCNNPSLDRAAERVNVIAENGLQVNMLALTSFSKDEPSKVRPACIARSHVPQGPARGNCVSTSHCDSISVGNLGSELLANRISE